MSRTTETTMYKKLLDVQKEVAAVKKDSTNPFFSSKYFDINALLAVVKPVLNKHGLVLTQQLTTIVDGKPGLRTSIINADDGVTIADYVPLPPFKNAQEMGSAVTYVRRYALQSMLGLQAEDDDANVVSGKTKAPVSKRPKQARAF